MERVVKKLDVVRPRIFWKVVQSVDKTSKVSVSEKTERAGDFDRIIEPLFSNVRLANEMQLPPLLPPSNFPSIAASVIG